MDFTFVQLENIDWLHGLQRLSKFHRQLWAIFEILQLSNLEYVLLSTDLLQINLTTVDKLEAIGTQSGAPTATAIIAKSGRLE